MKDLRLFLCKQKAYFSQILSTNLFKSVFVSTSFAKIIQPRTSTWLSTRLSKISHLDSWCLFAKPKNFCTNGLDLTAVCHRNRLEWANAHLQWRLALWDESWFSLYQADGRQFTDVNIVNRVPHLNAQRYHGKILGPIVAQFIQRHRLMLQHDSQSHVARISTQFLKAENIPDRWTNLKSGTLTAAIHCEWDLALQPSATC